MPKTWLDTCRNLIAGAVRDGQKRGLTGWMLQVHVDAMCPYDPTDLMPHRAWKRAMRERFPSKGVLEPVDPEPDYWSSLARGGTPKT